MSSFKRFVKNNTRSIFVQRQSVMLTATLSVLVMFLVSFVLTKPADSMTGQLICGAEAHTHDESCYELICGYGDAVQELEAAYVDDSTEETVEESGEAVETIVQHEHSDECFHLACEVTEHTHSQDCYESIQEETTTENSDDFLSVIYNSGIEIAEGENGTVPDDTVAEQPDDLNNAVQSDETPQIEHFTDVVRTIPTDGTVVNIRDYLIDNQTIGQKTYNTGFVNELSGIVNDSVTSDFTLSFKISPDKLTKNDANKPLYLYYELPEGITFGSDMISEFPKFGEDAKGYDLSGANAMVSSYYSRVNIDDGKGGKKGFIVFRVTEQYYKEKINVSNASELICSMKFTMTAARDKTQNEGDRTFNYNSSISDTIGFSDYAANLMKSGNYDVNNNRIDWTVKISDNTVNTDFAGATLEDTMRVQYADGTPEAPANCQIIPDSMTVDKEGIFDVSTMKFLRDITPEDGIVTIKYSTTFDDNIYSSKENFSFTYYNKASVKKDSDTIIEKEGSVWVGSPAASISKEGYYDYQYPGEAAVENKSVWVINLSTKYGTQIGGYKLNDANFSNLATGETIKVYDSSGNLMDSSNYTCSDGVLTFNDNVTDKSVKVVFKTDKTITENTVTFTYPNGKPGWEEKANIYGDYNSDVGKISKTGNFDYRLEDVAVVGGHSVWTITATADNDLPLSGVIITDEGFKAMPETIKVYDSSSGSRVLLNENTDYTLSGNEIKLSNTVTSDKIEVVYETSKDITANEATLNNNAEKKATATISNDYKPFTGSITGKYLPDTKQIEWTFGISSSHDSYASIDNAKATSELLKEIPLSDGNPSYEFRVNNVLNNDKVSVTPIIDVTNGTVEYDAPAAEGKDLVKKAEIIFTVDANLTDEQIEKLKNDETVTIEKTGSVVDTTAYGVPNDFKGSVTIKGRNTITKSYVNSDNYSKNPTIAIEHGETNPILNWKVEITRDFGFSGGNKAFVDVMTAMNADTNPKEPSQNADHYIASEQRQYISVEGKTTDGNYVTLVNGTDYTIKFYEDSTDESEADSNAKSRKFEIVFLEAVDTANYTYVKIEYKTLADISMAKAAEKIEFNNTAKYNNAEASANNKFTANLYDRDEQNYQKIALDKDGKEIDTSVQRDLKNIEKATIDNVEYYIFRWRINTDNNNDDFSLTDTFNEGFTLCTDSEHAPTYKYQNNPNYSEIVSYTDDTAGWNINYDNSQGNTVIFNKIWGTIEYLDYCTKIPVTEFDEKFPDVGFTFEISNTVQDSDDEFNPQVVSYTVIKKPEETEYDNYIDKEYIPNAVGNIQNNKLKYSIDLNQKAEDIANGDEVILKDIFSSDSSVDYKLYSLKVYGVDNATNEETELNINEYLYQFNNEGSDEYVDVPDVQGAYTNQFIAGTANKNVDDANNRGSLQQGDIITLTITCESLKNTSYSNHGIEINGLKYGSNQRTKVANLTNQAFVFDENGQCTFSYVNPGDYDKLEFWINLKDSNYNSVNYDRVELTSVKRHNAFSELQVFLPDARHLRVEYVYEILQNGAAPTANTTIVFDNTATLIANKTSTDSVNGNSITFYYGDDVDFVIASYPTIKKYDVGDYSLTGLNATFKLAMYDGTDGSWKWCNKNLAYDKTPEKISSGDWSVDKNDAYSIETKDGIFMLDGLVDGNFYALVEEKVPDGSQYNYKYEPVGKIKPYYFVYGRIPNEYPPDLDGTPLTQQNVNKIYLGDAIRVTNNRIIDVTVNKQWDDYNSVGSSIKVELYWSYKKSINGFPSEMTLATAADLNIDSLQNTVSITNGTYTWEELPNGINGRPIYYYVKETEYTVGGVTYTLGSDGQFTSDDGRVGKYYPLYTGNATASTENKVSIFNAGSLKVKKYWYDAKNRDLPPNMKTDKIEFKVYGQNYEGGNEFLLTNPTTGTEKFEITAENNWTYVFDESILGTYKFFRIEEITKPGTGFTTSYSGTYIEHYGTLNIINKSDESDPKTDIKVKKNWVDGNDTASRPLPEFEVWRKIDSDTDWTKFDVGQPTQNGNVYEYKNVLPYRDENGNIYTYKVTEKDMEGYIASYPEGNDGIQCGDIAITNTKTLDINVDKIWKDSYKNEYVTKSITVNLMRVSQLSDANPNSTAVVYKTKTISQSDNWKYTFEDCPAYNELGNPYHYWIVEDDLAGYLISYEYSGTIVENNHSMKLIKEDDATVTITNSYDYPPVMLPATGGIGKTIYYITGIVAILSGCTIYIVLRRIKKVKK